MVSHPKKSRARVRRRAPRVPAPVPEPYDASDAAFVAELITDRYEVVRTLGRGALACTHLVRDTTTSALGVARVVHSEIARDESARAHIRRLAIAGISVEHPNVVRTLAVAPAEARAPYAICEYVEGKDLRTLMRAEGRLGVKRAIGIARDVAAALEAVHAKGMVSGSLRPGDVLVEDATGRAKVYDFDSPLFGDAGLLGNPTYAAPEQLQDPGSGPRAPADVYALGVILYEMLTGHAPFSADPGFAVMLQKSRGEWTPVRDHCPDVPFAVTDLIAELLVAAPSRRPSAGDVAARLTVALSELGD